MEWISSLRARRHVRASLYRAALEDLPAGLNAGGLDARLRMPGGHGYWSLGDDIMYARLGKRGRRLDRARPIPN